MRLAIFSSLMSISWCSTPKLLSREMLGLVCLQSRISFLAYNCQHSRLPSVLREKPAASVQQVLPACNKNAHKNTCKEFTSRFYILWVRSSLFLSFRFHQSGLWLAYFPPFHKGLKPFPYVPFWGESDLPLYFCDVSEIMLLSPTLKSPVMFGWTSEPVNSIRISATRSRKWASLSQD